MFWDLQDDNRLECKLELSFEEQVPYIKAFWNTVSEAEQQELLTIGVAELRQKALQLSQACLHWPGERDIAYACIDLSTR